MIQRPNTGESPVQPASTQIVASPQASATANQPSPPQTVHAAATPSAVSHAAAPAAEASGAVAFHINFAFNSAVLPDFAHVMIDRIAQLMKEEPQVKLRVEGHTDAAGSADYNISLSEQRALSVAQYPGSARHRARAAQADRQRQNRAVDPRPIRGGQSARAVRANWVSLSRDHDHADGGGPSKAGTKTCFVSCVDKLCNTVAMLHLMFLVLLKRAVSSVLFAAHFGKLSSCCGASG